MERDKINAICAQIEETGAALDRAIEAAEAWHGRAADSVIKALDAAQAHNRAAWEALSELGVGEDSPGRPKSDLPRAPAAELCPTHGLLYRRCGCPPLAVQAAVADAAQVRAAAAEPAPDPIHGHGNGQLGAHPAARANVDSAARLEQAAANRAAGYLPSPGAKDAALGTSTLYRGRKTRPC